MKVGMIQSNYLPWRGYFDFIDDVDLFIFYDDVQYSRHDWRNRNKIKTAQGSHWITVPVFFSLNKPVLIKDALINHGLHWQKKHISAISQSYSKTPFFKYYSQDLFSIIQRKFKTISELNIALIKWLMVQLAIDVPTTHSSDYINQGKKTDRIVSILKQVHANAYLSGPSASTYLDIDKFKQANIELYFKNYEYEPYPQLHGSFESQVSMIDLLFNCGGEARKYWKSCFPNQLVH